MSDTYKPNLYTGLPDIAAPSSIVTSVTNVDGSVTVSPTTGAVVISVAPTYKSIDLVSVSYFGGL
jgi:hypothetical protein